MKVITYLGFTVLSIFIQFCVMDFIQEKIDLKTQLSNASITYQKKVVDDLLKNISSKPHALYYRAHASRTVKRSPVALSSFPEKTFSNSSIPAVPLGTTDVSTTIFDILYDENTSDAETSSTTETIFTTTDFENITEITFFETKNMSIDIPKTVPKINFRKYCGCNLLYQVCDINCCCDMDCSNNEQKDFQCEKKQAVSPYDDGCISHLLDSDLIYGSSMLDSLFCVVKTNIPEKRNVKKPNLLVIDHYNKWKSVQHQQVLYEFKKTLYKYSDPIWLLKNGTIYYLDFPTPMVNTYCTDRAPIKFLKDEKIRCNVKFNDLEMFHIDKTAEESMVISATERSLNSSALNCSNLHCINWTILACDNDVCMKYNKSHYEASCTESVCTNLALKIDYQFYYYDSKIINATIKFHIENISNVLPFLSQEITVKFIMSNKSLDNVIEFSGNPGYISNLPIIISTAKSNFTEHFFNRTMQSSKLNFPLNKEGICFSTNSSQNFVRFGLNKRTKCRYVHAQRTVRQNITSVCKSIQENIQNLLGLDKEIYISPFGNPYGIRDENWIHLQKEISEEIVYGEYSDNLSKLHCFHLINRISVTFVFANVDENDFTDQNKIIFAKLQVITNNVTFYIEDISSVITIDITFLDATKPNLYVYAGSPHLNIHLPKDFFFPFKPNNCFHVSNSCVLTILCCVAIFLQIK
ncbi:tectonic-1-like isoform X1 [Anticarsia gemmatalis]|uniref:tectonic-1-like isoform X1 n=1 Tax=Anticarsia gemmatalis TaxID=129554 RepID=UPI003F75A929